MPTVETYVTVDVDLDEFSDDDLLEELESRGLAAEATESSATELIYSIYNKRRLGQDYLRELDKLIYNVTGKIV